MFLRSQSYDFDVIAHIGPLYDLNDCKTFRSNRMDSFRENRKMFKNDRFLIYLGLILTIFLRSQSFDFAAIVHAG